MASGDLGSIESSRLSVCVSGVCKCRTEMEIKSKRDYCHRENALGIGSGSSPVSVCQWGGGIKGGSLILIYSQMYTLRSDRPFVQRARERVPLLPRVVCLHLRANGAHACRRWMR